MARVLAQHGIESFVRFWITKFRNSNDTRHQRRFIEKAIKQIQFFLSPPCCLDPDGTIEFRRLDNDLTLFIAAQLAQGGFDRRKWRKSLERAIALLDNIINNACCFVSFAFTRVGQNCCGNSGIQYTLSILDNLDYSEIIPCVSAGTPSSGTFKFPKELSGPIQLQLSLDDGGNYATMTVYDQENNIIAEIEDIGSGNNSTGVGQGIYLSEVFEASLLHHIVFGCTNSG